MITRRRFLIHSLQGLRTSEHWESPNESLGPASPSWPGPPATPGLLVRTCRPPWGLPPPSGHPSGTQRGDRRWPRAAVWPGWSTLTFKGDCAGWAVYSSVSLEGGVASGPSFIRRRQPPPSSCLRVGVIDLSLRVHTQGLLPGHLRPHQLGWWQRAPADAGASPAKSRKALRGLRHPSTPDGEPGEPEAPPRHRRRAAASAVRCSLPAVQSPRRTSGKEGSWRGRQGESEPGARPLAGS